MYEEDEDVLVTGQAWADWGLLPCSRDHAPATFRLSMPRDLTARWAEVACCCGLVAKGWWGSHTQALSLVREVWTFIQH